MLVLKPREFACVSPHLAGRCQRLSSAQAGESHMGKHGTASTQRPDLEQRIPQS